MVSSLCGRLPRKAVVGILARKVGQAGRSRGSLGRPDGKDEGEEETS